MGHRDGESPSPKTQPNAEIPKRRSAPLRMRRMTLLRARITDVWDFRVAAWLDVGICALGFPRPPFGQWLCPKPFRSQEFYDFIESRGNEDANDDVEPNSLDL